VTTRVTEQITIDAPVETVFGFFDDVENAPMLVANFEAVTRVEPIEGGGRRTEYTTRNTAGELVEMSSEHVEYDAPHRTVTNGVQSGLAIVATREFTPVSDGVTLVTASVEWSAPVKYVSRFVEYPLRGPYRRSLRHALTSAKDAIESRI
jgi:uncharacterized membrane protein